jgi:hypothetical protein
MKRNLARACAIAILAWGMALGADAPKVRGARTSPQAGRLAVDPPTGSGPLGHVEDVDPGTLTSGTTGQPPRGHAPPARGCFCCTSGALALVTLQACGQQGGTCLQGSQEEAARQCRRCWCCADGQVSWGTQAECEDRSGACAAQKGQALALCNPG